MTVRSWAKSLFEERRPQVGLEHPPAEPSRKPKVLVVDDEPTIANTLSIILEQTGFIAKPFYSGEAALQATGHFVPDLLITDVVMTGMTGIETAIHIRAKFPKCKVYLFAGQAATADLIERAKRQGHSFDMLMKPVHPTDLLKKLRAERFDLEEEPQSNELAPTPNTEDQLAVTLVGNRLKLVNLAPDGSSSLIEEVSLFRNLLYVYSLETQAFKAAVDELEHLINDPKTSEGDLQDFFERNPTMISGEEYKEVHPHVVLSREEGDLIPDFFLEPHDQNELCDLLDLKKPNVRIFNLQKNRQRLSASVHEGIAQLREYANYFNESKNRRLVSDRYKLNAYKPKMFLIIGRRGSIDPFKRREVMEQVPSGVQLKTYDDVLLRAQTRLSSMKVRRRP